MSTKFCYKIIDNQLDIDTSPITSVFDEVIQDLSSKYIPHTSYGTYAIINDLENLQLNVDILQTNYVNLQINFDDLYAKYFTIYSTIILQN